MMFLLYERQRINRSHPSTLYQSFGTWCFLVLVAWIMARLARHRVAWYFCRQKMEEGLEGCLDVHFLDTTEGKELKII